MSLTLFLFKILGDTKWHRATWWLFTVILLVLVILNETVRLLIDCWRLLLCIFVTFTVALVAVEAFAFLSILSKEALKNGLAFRDSRLLLLLSLLFFLCFTLKSLLYIVLIRV